MARLRRSRATGPQAAAPIAVVAAAAMVVAAAMSSCARQRLETQRPFRLTDVPTIRVRLAGPTSSETVSSTGGYRLVVDGRAISQSDDALDRTTVRRRDGHWYFNSLAVAGREAVLEPTGGMLRVGSTAYRGRLHFVAGDEDRFLVINHVDLESYLAGVLAKELYPYWSRTTFRALAIAARTFALYHMKTTGVGKPYDVGDDQGSQVYGGASAETERAWQAVRETHGQVLTYGPAGQERIFLAQYSAACGGVVNAASVIRAANDIPPLRGGQTCTDCRRCPHYRWGPVKLTKAEIYRAAAAAYPEVTKLKNLATVQPVVTTDYGRIVWLDLVDSQGTKVRLRAEDLRLALLRHGGKSARRVYSMNCQIHDAGKEIEFADGHGFGHGVGLCQWGAQAKAEQGWQAEDILMFYYPGATILPAY